MVAASRSVGDLVFKGVVCTLGLVTAGSLVWFGATGANIVSESNRRLTKSNDARGEHGSQ